MLLGLIKLRVKWLCLCLLLLQSAGSLEISTTFGKQDNEGFSVLTLRNQTPFACQEILDAAGTDISIECKIDSVPDRGFSGLENDFFKVTYKMIEKQFYLYIYPKYRQKLFSIPKNPKQGFVIDKYPAMVADVWQIVGFKEQIPFLSPQAEQRNGLDFPVRIEGEAMPMMPELNSDNRPLVATKNRDFEAYSDVIKLMERKAYITAINDINYALKENPDSVFRRDLTYLRIIAMINLDLEEQEPIINAAQDWLRAFSADPDVPEILYILANSYNKENIPSEAEHYYKRISDEYPQSRFSPLAKMQLAIMQRTSSSPIYVRMNFQGAYTEAKDLPSASEVALQWALFELEQSPQNPTSLDRGRDLISKVLQVYPAFFLDEKSPTLDIIEDLLDNKLYDLAARLTLYLHDNSEDAQKEQYGFDLGEYYELAGDFDNAHKANQAFLQDYPKSQFAKEVQERDDVILFSVKGDDDDKLKHYAYLMEKYPNGEEASKARDLSAEILLKRSEFHKVLELYGNASSPHKQKALMEIIKLALEKKDCKEANTYLIRASVFDLSPAQKMQSFDCLVSSGLMSVAKSISSGMVESSSVPKERLEWLRRITKNLYTLGEFKPAVMAARDGFSLAQSLKTHYDIAFSLFDALVALDSRDEAKKVVPFLREHFGKQEKILPVYAKLLEYALESKDQTQIQVYANNIIELQNALKIEEYTPYAEFALATSLKETSKATQALNLLQKLESKRLDSPDKQRLFYQIASIYNTQGKDSKALEYFNKCASVNLATQWQSLCKEAISFINSQKKSAQDSSFGLAQSKNP